MSWLVVIDGVAVLIAGGAFLAFSTLVPGGLTRLDDEAGARAMQQVNIAAPQSPMFMLAIFGPGLWSVVVAVLVVLDWDSPGAPMALAGAVVYLVGAVGMTIVFHMPRNDALGALSREDAAARWRPWIRTWVLGNHLRTASAIAAGILLLASQQ